MDEYKEMKCGVNDFRSRGISINYDCFDFDLNCKVLSYHEVKSQNMHMNQFSEMTEMSSGPLNLWHFNAVTVEWGRLLRTLEDMLTRSKQSRYLCMPIANLQDNITENDPGWKL